MESLNNINIKNFEYLISPKDLINEIPNNSKINNFIKKSRQTIKNILNRIDNRLLIIIGPCSIHDPIAALEYATKLKKISDELDNELFIVMRTYFEKPRTTIGWKGLINDPDLNGTYNINKGLKIARKLLFDINNLNLPCSIEFLDTISPQYTSDLISWGAIGARTTECQLHRELTSGLSMSIGFKNGTNGNIKIALDAIESAKEPHNFLGIDETGKASIIQTKGNNNCHIILRGSNEKPNYYIEDIIETSFYMYKRNILPNIMIDCSHGNSQKNHKNQPNVVKYLSNIIKSGNDNIIGLMIESNLKEGNQKLINKDTLEYGKSITDACINFEDSISNLRLLADSVKYKRNNYLST
jgi:3-deoxy-7-phosphoheptulonate synthase